MGKPAVRLVTTTMYKREYIVNASSRTGSCGGFEGEGGAFFAAVLCRAVHPVVAPWQRPVFAAFADLGACQCPGGAALLFVDHGPQCA